MPSTAEAAIRNYLTALRDPSALRDDAALEQLRQQVEQSGDELERLRLRQQLFDAEQPSAERFEDDFVTHAKAWAEQHGISAKAFEAEGVPAAVLRRAGFSGVRGAGRRRGRRATTRTRSRVTSEQVRAAMPRGTFTIKTLQERSGASTAVVRKVVQEEIAAGRLKEEGTDPDHKGPGRSPTLYKKGR